MSFHVILPSNTRVEDNKTNSFVVRLPRTLQFNSDWSVGLAVIDYPHSWPSIGTIVPQFVEISWNSGDVTRFTLPCQRFDTAIQLQSCLSKALLNEDAVKVDIQKHSEWRKASSQNSKSLDAYNEKEARLRAPTSYGEHGFWIEVLKKAHKHVFFTYNPEMRRFHTLINKDLKVMLRCLQNWLIFWVFQST